MKIASYPVDGKYGKYGGRFVPEVLMEAIKELEEAYGKLEKTQISKKSWIIIFRSLLADQRPCIMQRT